MFNKIKYVLLFLLLIFSILSIRKLYADNPIIYKINELNSHDIVFKNFLKDVFLSKRFSKFSSEITLDDIEKYGILPKFKMAKYTLKKGDNIVNVSKKLYINPETLVSVNKYTHISQVKKDTIMLIPNMKGVLHTIKEKTNVPNIAKLYGISEILILYTNNIKSKTLFPAEDIFIPNGKISDSDVEDFLGRVFLVPIENPIISSDYGMRKDPFTGEDAMHYGIDYEAEIGTPVYASQYGIVSKAKIEGNYGKLVVIKHKGNFTTYYGHLSKISVEVNQLVQTGEKIGEVGSTGRSTGPHLHFEIRSNNTPVNPHNLENFGKDKPSFVNFLETQKSSD